MESALRSGDDTPDRKIEDVRTSSRLPRPSIPRMTAANTLRTTYYVPYPDCMLVKPTIAQPVRPDSPQRRISISPSIHIHIHVYGHHLPNQLRPVRSDTEPRLGGPLSQPSRCPCDASSFKYPFDCGEATLALVTGGRTNQNSAYERYIGPHTILYRDRSPSNFLSYKELHHTAHTGIAISVQAGCCR